MYAVLHHAQECVFRPGGFIDPRKRGKAGKERARPGLRFEDTTPKIERLTSSTYVHDGDTKAVPTIPGNLSQESPSVRKKGVLDGANLDMSKLKSALPASSSKGLETPTRQITQEVEIDYSKTPILGTVPTTPGSRGRIQGAEEEVFVEAALYIFLQIITMRHLPSTSEEEELSISEEEEDPSISEEGEDPSTPEEEDPSSPEEGFTEWSRLVGIP